MGIFWIDITDQHFTGEEPGKILLFRIQSQNLIQINTKEWLFLIIYLNL